MMGQGLAVNDILLKKFKILRTGIMLGNIRNREETFNDYEETAKEIDKIHTRVYEELLGSKLYTTLTLEEEKERLENLISFVEKRVKERNDFVDDYIKITSTFLDGLDNISFADELTEYKYRYDNICEYLNNCEEIKKLEFNLKNLRDELEEKYENKANNELINSRLEDELIEEFNKFVNNHDYYKELNYLDIDIELDKLEESIAEKKGVLDTFSSSYKALMSAGISGTEREEYSSYVNEAKYNYYEDVDKKYILNIYKLVLDKQVDYDKLYEKRVKIDNVINDRNVVRNELNITKRDILEFFIDLCKEQLSVIKSQKFGFESIDDLILEIANGEDRLAHLQEANNRSEILKLLEEFNVENIEIEKFELPEEKHYYVDNKEFSLVNIDGNEEIVVHEKPSNMVVKIKEPLKINVKSASDTAKLVMKKVVIVLEPKKFSGKRDKLKEAKLQLAEEKVTPVKLEKEENKIDETSLVTEDIKEENIFTSEVNDENFVEKDVDSIFSTDNKDEVINTIDSVKDIFLDDDEGEIGFNLSTKESSDKDVKDVIELKDVKLNASDYSNMIIPTEIFIEDPPKEEIDLFKVTDPFLDDNEFELEDNTPSDQVRLKLPNLGSIGTVKPNNALAQIESVVKESEDVILPNLGLVETEKEQVPIVGENYIS